MPVCFSASHVAYSSLRMEPQYMIIGHAAGVAAALALRDKVRPHDIDVKQLQDILLKEAAVFEYSQSQQERSLQIIRDRHATRCAAADELGSVTQTQAALPSCYKG